MLHVCEDVERQQVENLWKMGWGWLTQTPLHFLPSGAAGLVGHTIVLALTLPIRSLRYRDRQSSHRRLPNPRSTPAKEQRNSWPGSHTAYRMPRLAVIIGDACRARSRRVHGMTQTLTRKP